MFSPVSVSLFVCVLTGLLKKYLSNMKRYGVIGRNPGSNRLDYE